MSSVPRYDRIGIGYRTHRRPEPQWASAIEVAVGDASSVLNVGAGTGSYEPNGLRVVAVEPSTVMIAQRPPDAAPIVRGVAEALPFPEGSFEVGMAVLTAHHWTDPVAGYAELRRVTDRQVLVTWELETSNDYWLVREYLPQFTQYNDSPAAVANLGAHLQVTDVVELLLPPECSDGVFAAYWRRPEAYLDPGVRANISGLSLLEPDVVEAAMDRLAADLDDGTWASRHGDLLERDHFDAGYRLVLART